MVNTKALLKTWRNSLPLVAVTSIVLYMVGYLSHIISWNPIDHPFSLLLILGFTGIAFGLEKHKFSWKKWVVLISGICLAFFVGSLTNTNLAQIWVYWILAVLSTTGLLAIDMEQTTISKMFPDYWTGIMVVSSFVALIILLI